MNRKKRPALTSPWKIGFLVSLLLLVTGIGVGFLITRTFGVAWSWVRFSGGTWVFDKDAFMREMSPMVVFVPLVSLIAYFLITGAVRRYRAYLESGQDYRLMVQALARIDDLQEDRIKSLKNYPELRDFLMRLKERIAVREQALEQKEASLAVQSGQMGSVEQFKVESGVLVGAIARGPQDGFNEELALALPELKQVEQAIRKHLLAGAVPAIAVNESERMANIREEVAEPVAGLRTRIEELGAEIQENLAGAREIELGLSQLRNEGQSGGGRADVDADGVISALERLDHASQSLQQLGEEAKGVAIRTALEAGSGGEGVEQLIKLAEEVRTLAARFNGVSGQYQAVGRQLREAAQALSRGGQPRPEMIEAVAHRAGRWAERAMILAERMNGFQQQFNDTIRLLEVKLGGGVEGSEYNGVADLTVDGLGAEPIAEASDPSVHNVTLDDFERQSLTSPFLGRTEPAEKEKRERGASLFEEISRGTGTNLFTDIPPSPGLDGGGSDKAPERRADSNDMFAEMKEQTGARKPESESAPGAKPHEALKSQVDLSGGDAEVSAKKPAKSAKPAAPVTPAPTRKRPTADVPLEVESNRYRPAEPRPAAGRKTAGKDAETVHDLYELGAVDYEPDGVYRNA